MKLFVFLLITWGLAMSFPLENDREIEQQNQVCALHCQFTSCTTIGKALSFNQGRLISYLFRVKLLSEIVSLSFHNLFIQQRPSVKLEKKIIGEFIF